MKGAVSDPEQLTRWRRAANCVTCRHRAGGAWSGLGSGCVSRLAQAKYSNVYRRGQTIFFQGNPCHGIYCVSAGCVGLLKTDADGNTMILRLAHPGETIGCDAFFARTPYTVSAQALTDSCVCFVDRTTVEALISAEPALGLAFSRELALELQRAQAARLQETVLPVRARMAQLLLSLREHCADVDEAGRLTIELPLRRGELALVLATRPETVTRTIRALERDGVARFNRRTVTVDDVDSLYDEVDGC